MRELNQLQEQLQQFILTGQGGINDSIVQTELVSIDTRLAIYRDGYKLRLIESLTTSFPALHAYLGTEAFQDVCSSYIATHPSFYRSIRWYGDKLAHFLQHYYDGNYAYLVELADFEWHMTLAFDAADKEVLQISDMASIPPESWAEMRFTFHPSLHRVNYFWNSVPLWQTLVHDEDIPEMTDNPVATAWVLWRSSDYLIQYYSLSEAEAWALDALIQGVSFGELCDGLCRWVGEEEVGMQAASYLKNWIQRGFLVSLL